MSLDTIVRSVAGRLSLREPQAESLRKLAAALEAVPELRNHQARSPEELAAMVEALKAQFPKLLDFERDFPSLCFALATGVGKTRLMGAFISYPLARAIEDGFVKEPAVVTQQNFDPSAHSAEQLERIKLMDGVRVHEETKVHLLTYAQQKGERPVKPFMLVIARDTTHASQLMQLISSELFGGRYAGKVIQVDSGTTSGTEGDEIVQRLLAVESYDEPTEIVIHVNMLKEGWDVTNLYTIVPLRAANARTLIEQSIGRGLRLPYGRKTGVEVVDRLNIIAHDKFQEVVDEAGRGDSPIRLKQLKLDPAGDAGGGLRSVAVTPTINTLLGIGAKPAEPGMKYTPGLAPMTVLYTGQQSAVALVAMDVINDLSRLNRGADDTQTAVPTSAALTQADVQAQIVRRVEELVVPTQAELLPPAGPTIADIVRKTMAMVAEHSIDIPRILVKPKGAVQTGYKPFALDVSRLNFQPQDQQLVGRGLQTGKDVLYGQSSTIGEVRLEDYIVRELIGFDDVSYDEHADLIYGLAGQAVAHFKTYLKADPELHNVLANQGKAIAENIHAQMAQQYFEDIGESEVVVHQGFTLLKPSAVTTEGEVLTLQQTPTEKSKIATVVYGGFAKCAYTFQKFQSDTERVLAQILERDSMRWLRPVQGQFNIYYRRGVEQPEYVPDFVAATSAANLLIETKKAMDIESNDVKAKAKAAVEWCEHASDYSAKHGGKPWQYLLIPHDAVVVNATLLALSAKFFVHTK